MTNLPEIIIIVIWEEFLIFEVVNKGGGEVSIEVIKKIRDAEEKAEAIKKDGTQKAKQIIVSANTQAQKIVEEAHRDSDFASSALLKKAEAEGQKLYDDIVKKADEECESILNKAAKNMETAVSTIVERIVMTGGYS